MDLLCQYTHIHTWLHMDCDTIMFTFFSLQFSELFSPSRQEPYHNYVSTSELILSNRKDQAIYEQGIGSYILTLEMFMKYLARDIYTLYGSNIGYLSQSNHEFQYYFFSKKKFYFHQLRKVHGIIYNSYITSHFAMATSCINEATKPHHIITRQTPINMSSSINVIVEECECEFAIGMPQTNSLSISTK